MRRSLIIKMKQLFGSPVTAVFLLVLTMPTVQAVNNKTTNSIVQTEEVILRWNRVLAQTIALPGVHSPNIFPARSYAMMHLAMFDAVNSVDGGHTPYLTEVPGSKNASLEAAAAQAAHDVLAGLYPGQQAVFQMELANSLVGIEENRARQGMRVGNICAGRILAKRANDG